MSNSGRHNLALEKLDFWGQTKGGEVKLVDKLSAEQRSALERVSAELAERGAREAREREEEFFGRCKDKLGRPNGAVANTSDDVE